MLLKAAQLRILCDRSDVKAVCPVDVDDYTCSISLFDTRHGGLGIAENIFNKFDELLILAKSMIEKCKCESGCPKCVQMMSCSSFNRNLAKNGGVFLLDLLIKRTLGGS